MKHATLDDASVASLAGPPEEFQFCDASGRIIGLFEPMSSRPRFNGRQVTLDEGVIEQLTGATGGVKLCDSQGNMIGVFRPVVWWEAAGCWEPKYSKEELERFENEPGGRSLDEILCDLQKLDRRGEDT